MDQVTLAKSSYRMEQWKQLILECRNSGLKVDEWCEQNNLSHHAYYYWLRKIRMAALAEQAGGFQPVAFKKLQVLNTGTSSSGPGVVIHLPAASLEVREGTSQATVEAVLLALKATC